jgi:hypothetical protein
MSTRTDSRPQRPLLDPDQFERAGRALKLWLEGLRHRVEETPDTSIAWEDGEPREPSRERVAR